MYSFYLNVFLFLCFGFIGWFIETMFCFVVDKKFVNRGFLIGPVCPIYGFGGLFITLFLTKYKADPITLFCMSIIICSVLEYFTSYLLEKIFKTRWWDYSNKKFNINGRVCLRNLLLFGLLGLGIIYLLNPLLIKLFVSINYTVIRILDVVLLLLIIADHIVSVILLHKINWVGKNLLKDSTEELNKKIKEVLINKNTFFKRYTDAFPNMNRK